MVHPSHGFSFSKGDLSQSLSFFTRHHYQSLSFSTGTISLGLSFSIRHLFPAASGSQQDTNLKMSYSQEDRPFMQPVSYSPQKSFSCSISFSQGFKQYNTRLKTFLTVADSLWDDFEQDSLSPSFLFLIRYLNLTTIEGRLIPFILNNFAHGIIINLILNELLQCRHLIFCFFLFRCLVMKSHTKSFNI